MGSRHGGDGVAFPLAAKEAFFGGRQWAKITIAGGFQLATRCVRSVGLESMASTDVGKSWPGACDRAVPGGRCHLGEALYTVTRQPGRVSSPEGFSHTKTSVVPPNLQKKHSWGY